MLAVASASGCGGTQIQCSPANCDGCCSDSGACVPLTGQSNASCGVEGAACRTCTPGNACTFGKCVGAADCGPSTCDGCCSSGACISLSQTSAENCGSGGEACDACLAGQSCSAGSCGGSGCNATSCPTGCCSSGACIQRANQSTSQCGNNGAGCVACSAGQTCGGGSCQNACGNIGQACCGGNICFTGQCNGGNCTGSGTGGGSGGGTGGGTGGGGGTTATKGIGDACTAGSECISGTCSGGRFTGGYCTQPCTTNANCPAGAACGNDPNDSSGFTKSCLKTCATAPTNPGTCRTGYVCDKQPSVDGESPVCTPACVSGQCSTNTCDSRGFCCGTAGFACCNNSVCNAGTACVSGYCQPQAPPDAGTGFVGDPCTSSSQCTGNFCETEVAPGAAANCVTTTCWPGGYCRPACTSASQCPTGTSCTYPELGSKCLLNCAWNGGRGSCRSGYVCDRGWSPFDRAQAVCVYACGSAQDCPSGASCVNGFCCGLPGYACCGGLNGTCLSGNCNGSAVCP